MRPIRFPWGPKALARRRAAAGCALQDRERRAAYARIAGLAATGVPEWDALAVGCPIRPSSITPDRSASPPS